MQSEKHLLFGRGRGRDGCIERVDNGRSELEMADDHGRNIGFEGCVGRQGCREAPLTAPDQVEPRMIARKALGRPGKRIAVELGKVLPYFRVLE